MIEKVIIENFQRHKYLEVELDKGFNCISGPSNVGKSAFVRAVAFCLFGKPWSSDWVREGASYCTVTVKFSDGRQITRKKGANVNEVTIKCGDEEERFTSFGTDYPERVQKFLGFASSDLEAFCNLNVAFQLDPPFFLSSPPQTRVVLLDKLTSLSRLREALSKTLKEIKELELERSRVDKSITEKREQLARLAFVETSYQEFLVLEKETIARLELLKRVEVLCQRIAKYKSARLTLRPAIECLERMILAKRKLLCVERLFEQERKIRETKSRLLELEKKVESLKESFRKRMVKLGVCPLCGSKIDESFSDR